MSRGLSIAVVSGTEMIKPLRFQGYRGEGRQEGQFLLGWLSNGAILSCLCHQFYFFIRNTKESVYFFSSWIPREYGLFYVLSSKEAYPTKVKRLFSSKWNKFTQFINQYIAYYAVFSKHS